MALTKAHTVENLHVRLGRTGFSKPVSTQVVETLFELIRSSLEQGEDVLISGFGKFCVKYKHERRGRNPQTGDEMMLTSRKVVTFKCSGILREEMNKTEEERRRTPFRRR